MRQGKLSYSKVRALTRVATPENETELLEFALSGTAAHVESLVRAWRQGLNIDRISGLPDWYGESLDLNRALEALRGDLDSQN